MSEQKEPLEGDNVAERAHSPTVAASDSQPPSPSSSPSPSPRPARDARLQLRVSSELKEQWRAYAEREHTSISAIVVQSMRAMLKAEAHEGEPSR